ncbi:MAG TPA: hydantoinase/oxoprolinase family protein, partial [Candidatus Limnocylindria bacterium]|nr:hydantoinase/oxoprolinase family protein [Candidatus Limnocylindria bacterium]
FHELHRRRFGHADPDRAVEVLAVRVRASGGAVPPPRHTAPRARGPVPITHARAWFGGRACRTGVVRRCTLGRGWAARGPLVVCEYSATTVVPPGWRLVVDRVGGLLLERGRRG